LCKDCRIGAAASLACGKRHRGGPITQDRHAPKLQQGLRPMSLTNPPSANPDIPQACPRASPESFPNCFNTAHHTQTSAKRSTSEARSSKCSCSLWVFLAAKRCSNAPPGPRCTRKDPMRARALDSWPRRRCRNSQGPSAQKCPCTCGSRARRGHAPFGIPEEPKPVPLGRGQQDPQQQHCQGSRPVLPCDGMRDARAEQRTVCKASDSNRVGHPSVKGSPPCLRGVRIRLS
jgi:hypothetical protein